MTKQQPNPPTEAEIAAAQSVGVQILAYDIGVHAAARIISRHNAPLHAKIQAQKSALELAQKAIEAIPELDDFRDKGSDGFCLWCYGNKFAGHADDCPRVLALVAIREALQ